MGDFLAKGKFARKLSDTLGLPLPAPETLIKSDAPYNSQPLTGCTGILQVDTSFQQLIEQAGLTVTDAEKADALILDGSAYKTVSDLADAHTFFSTNLKKLKRNGRVLILSGEGTDTVSKAIQRGLEGISRSIAKEIGRKGATANLLVWQGSDPTKKDQQLILPAVYLLSRYSAYVDGQAFKVSDQIAANGSGYDGALKDKVALVTGAARGIGAAIAISLAREGAKVMIVDIPQEGEHAQKVAQEIGGSFLAMDVTQEDAPQKVKEWLQKEAGGMDILVHNAGITRDKTLAKMDRKYWDQVLAVNLQAIFSLNDALIPDTLHDSGTIMYMSSISGLAGNFGQTNYAATKAALIGYAASLAPSLVSRGISVNAIAPGFIETKMTETMPFFTREGGRRLNNLSQAGYPEDIAEMAAFLAMPGSRGITGQVLRVCGGSLIGA